MPLSVAQKNTGPGVFSHVHDIKDRKDLIERGQTAFEKTLLQSSLRMLELLAEHGCRPKCHEPPTLGMHVWICCDSAVR